MSELICFRREGLSAKEAQQYMTQVIRAYPKELFNTEAAAEPCIVMGELRFNVSGTRAAEPIR